MAYIKKYILSPAYHIWFYFLIFFFASLISPMLYVFTLSNKTYPQFYWLARNVFARGILFFMGIYPRIAKYAKLTPLKQYILTPNHASFLDFILVYVISKKPLKFMGKVSLQKYPLFGYFYKKVTVTVDRSKLSSRKQSYSEANMDLKSGVNLCIFPEGGIPDYDIQLKEFHTGAFRLSLENQIPIIPITFKDTKEKLPYSFMKSSVGICNISIHEPQDPTKYKINEKMKFAKKVRSIILEELTKEDV